MQVPAYRLTEQHLAEPIDVKPMLAALPDKDGEPILDMRELGDMLMTVAETLPAAHLSGAFDFVYSTLTTEFGNGIHDRRSHPHLPVIDDPDTLQLQAWHFALTRTEPLRQYGQFWLASRDKQMEIYRDMPPGWRENSFSDRLKKVRDIVVFMCGMITHITDPNDLPESLIASQPPESYFNPETGGFFVTDQYIHYVAHALSPELLRGDPAVVHRLIDVVVKGIAKMRSDRALPLYRQLKRFGEAGDAVKYRAVKEQGAESALATVRTVATIGGTAVGGFERFASSSVLRLALTGFGPLGGVAMSSRRPQVPPDR